MGGAIRIFATALLLVLAWAAAIAFFAWKIDSYALDDSTNADAIVVLTGGGGRVEYGLELLANGRGKALFISGVNKSVPLGDLLNAAPDEVRSMIGVLSFGKITLGREATNTVGNAEESMEWIRSRGYKSVLLVTADYHMPRAKAEFKANLPRDVVLIAAPVDTGDYKSLGWVNDVKTRNLILSEFHKLIFARLRHYLIRSTS